MGNDEDGDVLTEVDFRLYEWKASAEVLSDPDLVEILTEPVPEPLGTPAYGDGAAEVRDLNRIPGRI